VQSTVPDPSGAGKIDCASELRQEWQRLIKRRGSVMPHRHVQRFRRDILLGAICRRSLDSGGNWFDY
jgi:hypothetical protein